jgi:hypothetical protein
MKEAGRHSSEKNLFCKEKKNKKEKLNEIFFSLSF